MIGTIPIMNSGPSILIDLDRTSEQPLAHQIEEQIKNLILSGSIQNNHKLQSTRDLSKQLGVNRATVTTAYRRLEAHGYARSGVGSGTYVVSPKSVQSAQLDQSIGSFRFSPGTEELFRSQSTLPDFKSFKGGRCNFAALVPDETLFPVAQFRECVDHVLARDGGQALQYSGTLGLRPLREVIAMRMARHGARVDADQILIVSGAQQGCDLIFRCFLSAGDRLVAGSPTYHNIFPLLRQMEASVSPVPVSETGLDPIALDQAAHEPSARLIYTMPNFQNPTGHTATLENRRKVLDIASAAGLPILEDDYEHDLVLDDDIVPSIQSLDTQGRVIYLGTFSKSLFPGLRVGWLAASREVIDRVAALKKASDLENSTLLQTALYEFCSRGYYDAHLPTVRQTIAERMAATFGALERHMPPGTTWSRPKGGYGLWVSLPTGVRSETIYLRAGERGVLVSPGSLFVGSGEDPGAIRLSISRTAPDVIDEGVRILGEVIAAELSAPRSGKTVLSETPQHL